jgi:ATP-dependent Clp protease ATP-binding subunit ClpC
LGELGRDLTALAKAGRLPLVVGRKKEMTAVARHLQRTSKRNVLLIGEAGVGKTAIVEGLAQRIAQEDAPEFLRLLRIIQLSVADLISGAKYRGDMERRLKHILQEATANPNIVLFIDEIHLVMKAGTGGEAPLDVANILKPALARDDFRCIGATTTEEYERYIKGEAAFARRFQLVRVAEPSPADALSMCQQWARRIEQWQQVVFAPEAVEAAVTLSANLIRARALPDKAIDLLENAAAYVKVSSLSFRHALPAKELPHIGRAEIEAVLREQYGITAAAAGVFDADHVRAALCAELVGQDATVEAIVETLASLVLRGEAVVRPLGVLLFAGPSGVGKTLAAECLARALFEDERALGRFNMSEYKERHELARLIGAPPGFIGHEQPGALFRFVEAHPQGLILLDEMEKAHAEIQDYFLQVFDKAEARDSRGRVVDFRRHLFVLTCNCEGPAGGGAVGFREPATRPEDDSGVTLHGALVRYFRHEFIDRLDRVVSFRALGLADYRMLLERHLSGIASRFAIKLEVTETVKDHLCAHWAAPRGGARGFLTLLERQLLLPLQQHLRSHSQTKSIRISLEGGIPVLS